ncbi:MAG: DNA primase [Candidatus Margulisbacteria bacterium]|nr:DNA primase [Candidatus Margulisiibacteriota bacterium]
MIPAQIIEEIRSKAEIVKIVSEYVPLRKRGKNYLGLCPFHPEKDPSFTVSPDKQLFHCFGCNEGGNVFAFIMKIENVGFAEAVEELGAKLGIAVPKPAGAGPTRTEKDKHYQVMQLAASFFRNNLSEPAQAYLDRRAITEKTKELFRLGFAPAGWDNLFNHLIARGVPPVLIERCGLALPRENKNGYYDRFRSRLIFPIVDQRDRVVAFGGRSLGDEEPKYLNSPDTLIYHKGETVFGLNLCKDHIKKSKTAVLVEGYFDLITPFQNGILNIVASLGTALTVAQCKLLSRYCENIVLAFDADSAGWIAAEKSADLLHNQGLTVKVARLKGGKDPDEVIRNQGSEAFKQCLNTALPLIEFKISRILSRHNLQEIESRARALREVAAVLSQEKDPFIQQEYVKLAAPLMKCDADALLAEIKRQQNSRQQWPGNLRRVTEKPSDKIAEAEKNLIALAAQNNEALKLLKEELVAEDFKLRETRAIADLLLAADFGSEAAPAHFLLENLPDEEAKKFLSGLLMSEHLSQGEKMETIIADCVKVIKGERLRAKIDDLKLEIKEAEKAGETGRVAELLSALKGEIS